MTEPNFKMITLSLPVELLDRLATLTNRSEVLRRGLRAGLEAGVQGSRRRRNSAMARYRQTTLLVDEELLDAMKAKIAKGERSSFAEKAVSLALPRT